MCQVQANYRVEKKNIFSGTQLFLLPINFMSRFFNFFVQSPIFHFQAIESMCFQKFTLWRSDINQDRIV